MGQKGFFDFQNREALLSEKKDTLLHIASLIPWEEFRPILSQIRHKERKSNAGRKPLDDILMFKLLVLQNLYNLSDDELEYQANDRLSFMRFLGLGIEDKVPDSKTIWLFREQLTRQDLIVELFELFDTHLRKNGYQAKGGQIMDATLIPVPKQRNSDEENQKLKQGQLPKDWEDHPHKVSQKDTDARWTKKGGQSYFGYKNHISIDREYRFIRHYDVTNASVHDSQVLGELIDFENDENILWADSAYYSELREQVLDLLGIRSEIHERGYRNQPLSQEQKEKNREKSKVRALVEHVFGSWITEMGGKLVRVIGMARVKSVIGLKNIVYNMKRYVYLETCDVV